MKHLHKQLNQMQSRLSRTMASDRVVFRRRIRKIRRQLKKESPPANLETTVASLQDALDQAILAKSRRRKNRPGTRGLAALPITRKRDVIIRAIKEHPVVIVSGETGSGKTTQIPKFCLAAGRGIDGLIGCTQPRRIAAITVADRIAAELGEKPGRSVGYKIRFQDMAQGDTYIKIMTDGILLAETQGDPYLNRYDTVIVDEAHERSLNIDFVLGILKSIQRKRKDLKLIVTSATIDTLKFSAAFDDAPVIEVSGRTYPVETRYQPSGGLDADPSDLTHVESAVSAVAKLLGDGPPGDILVFMPTEQDIRDTCDLLAGCDLKKTRLLPLYARLSAAEQQRVFKATRARKIIVATNIAETSLTIPGIRYVVDTGLARISQYSPRSRITSLPVVPISQSSADQRLGRSGRMADGVCIRLFSEEDYAGRPRYTQPEILRSNLADVILRMLHLKLGSPRHFPFIDPPPDKSIQDGFNLLAELGAIRRRKRQTRRSADRRPHRSAPKTTASDSRAPYKLTPIGRIMAKLPIDPRLSRILVEADKRRCLGETTVIVAALSIQDPRERPLEKEAQADAAHKQFAHPQSDFLSLLNIWHACRQQTAGKQYLKSFKQFCQSNFLSFKRMREWQDIYSQITRLLAETGFTVARRVEPIPPEAPGTFSRRYARIHQSILSGYLGNIAQKKEKQYFQAARERQIMLFPGSGIFDTSGQWIVAAEMVETSRLFARTCANIDVDWLEEFGGDLCRRSYRNPRWSRKRGTVIADEQVTLFGLTIVAKRVVDYGPIDPVAANRIFIMQGLIPGQIEPSFGFLNHNLELDRTVADMENRIRRQDIRVDDEQLFSFYQQHLNGVCDVAGLRKRIAAVGDDSFLRLALDDYMRYNPDSEELAAFPDTVQMGPHTFPIDYRFDTASPKDGITVKVPASFTSEITPEHTDWLVPGLLREKIETMIKSLPKQHRKKLLPLSATLQTIVDEMPRTHEPLAAALSQFLHQRMGVDIPATVWTDASLPDHLNMRIALTDDKAKVLATGRDIRRLKQRYAREPDPQILADARRKWQRTGIEAWDFGDLPDAVTVGGRPQGSWVLYPALRRDAETLGIDLLADKAAAEASHRAGVAHLFQRYLASDLRHLQKNLRLPAASHAAAKYSGGRASIEKQIFERVTAGIFQKNIRRQVEFFDRLEKLSRQGIHRLGQDLLQTTVPVLENVHRTHETLKRLATTNRGHTNILQFLTGLDHRLQRLVPHHFVELYDIERLRHLPRYAKAIRIRAQRAVINFEKDQAKQLTLSGCTDQLDTLIETLAPDTTPQKRRAIENLFWLLEEYHVSLFAQELKTAVPVSEARIKDAVQAIQHMI